MLYVFHVDTGTMLTFDMKLAMSAVSVLQDALAQTFHISADKQVLLISGGENLDPNARVGSYHAGTDTNPIFLFSKSSIESATPPMASVNYGSEADLKDQVEGCLAMSATYETVVTRAQLALQFYEVAREELQVCERLVRDQHLQHQGWAAVIANLEDITSAFKARSEGFKSNFIEYLKCRERYLSVLDSFPSAINLLSKVPLLPCLLGSKILPPQIKSTQDLLLSPNPQTLLQWISAQDSRSNLDQMVLQCQSGLRQFNDSVKDSLLGEVSSLLEAIHNPSMKEVKGLEDRLYGLEQLLIGARKLLQEQDDMAQGFVANQNRVSNLRDPSILPDLCASHKKQLGIMLKNHQSLRDIRRRCTAAKEELSANLHTRLRWVMVVEKSICDVDRKLMIHHETLKKLKRRLEIVQQMENAPNVYAQAVVEVVRRKHFSRAFLEWAGSLADECRHIHQEEAHKRQQFAGYLRRHFLQSLFPGFEDSPPKFASEPPGQFDDKLPPITEGDLEFLRREVPELSEKFKLPGEVELAPRSSSATLKASPTPSFTHTPPGNLMSLLRRDPAASDIVVLNPDLQEYPSGGAVFAMDTEQMGDLDSVAEQPKDFLPLEGVDITPAEQDDEMDIPRSSDVTGSVEVIEEKGDEEDEGEFLSLPSDGQEGQDVPMPSLSPPKVPPVSVSAQNKVCKGEGKSSSELSPEAETNSDGFTTADFYIDESMPSSMTDSPPTKKLIAELQHSILLKNNLIESKDKDIEERANEVREVKEKLTKMTNNLLLLHQLAEKETKELKGEVVNIKNEFSQEKADFQVYIQTVTQKIIEVINKFESEQSRINDEAAVALREQYDREVQELADKLEEEAKKLEQAKAETETYELQLRGSNEKYEELKSDMEAKIHQMEIQLAKEVEQAKNTLILEHEVELEKVQHELQCDLEAKDAAIVELKSSLEQKEKMIEDLTRGKEEEIEELRRKFQEEKEEVMGVLQAEFEAKKSQLEAELRSSLEESHCEAVAKLEAQHAESLATACQQQREEQEAAHAAALDKLREDLQQTHAAAEEAIRVQLTREKEQALETLQQELSVEFEKTKAYMEMEWDSRRQELEAQMAAREENIMSLERHGCILNEIKQACEQEKERALAQALEKRDTEHQQALDMLTEKLLQEKQDMASSMQTSITAEKQVLFNAAMNKVVAEKDKVIEELRTREAVTAEERDKLRVQLDELAAAGGTDPETLQSKNEEMHLLQKKYSDELTAAQQQIRVLQEQLSSSQGAVGGWSLPAMASSSMSAMGVSTMGQSVVSVSESPSAPSILAMQDKIQFLEMTLKSKDEEMCTLKQKMMNLSMTTSSRNLALDKVSITTCQVSDLVLLCLDERHDHYVVFNMGTTLHFLHSECLGPLGLVTNPGEPRKSWVLAEITEKEYCQAKKAQNRFKVPLGTKFYRVKAKRWDRDAARHQMLREALPPST